MAVGCGTGVRVGEACGVGDGWGVFPGEGGGLATGCSGLPPGAVAPADGKGIGIGVSVTGIPGVGPEDELACDGATDDGGVGEGALAVGAEGRGPSICSNSYRITAGVAITIASAVAAATDANMSTRRRRRLTIFQPLGGARHGDWPAS